MSLVLNAALEHLTEQDDGGWTLEAAAAKRFAAWLTFFVGGPRGSYEALRPLLKLVAVLEADERSASAAQTLIRILRESPATFEMLFQAQEGGASQARRTGARFISFSGRTRRTTTRTHDAPAPEGSLPGRVFMRPLDAAAVRAQKR